MPAPESSVTVIVYLTVMTSPSARYWVRSLATAKFQLTVPSWVAVLSPLRVRAPGADRASSRSCETEAPTLAVAEVKATVVSERSVASTSAKSMEPEATRSPALRSESRSSMRSAVTNVSTMVGLSFEPVMVRVT